MFNLKLATKANTKVISQALRDSLAERFKNLPNMIVKNNAQIRLSPVFFSESGIETTKSVNYGAADGKVYLVTMEGNEGVSFKQTLKGKKNRVNKSESLLELLVENGLFEGEKQGYDLVLTDLKQEGVLEIYEVVKSDKSADEKEDDNEVELATPVETVEVIESEPEALPATQESDDFI